MKSTCFQSNEGLPGVLGNKGTKGKYRREQRNMTPVLGSSGMRTLKTHFETVSDWSVVKWSVLIGQSPKPRD